MAVNNGVTDYVACARALAKNIHALNPNARVCLLTDDIDNQDPAFDLVRLLPFGDRSQGPWKLENDWQCFYASPFRRTLKLEADMLLPTSIDHWFDILQNRDVALTAGARDCRNSKSSVRHYRKIFDDNDLPDIYNAITYWRLSRPAEIFFNTLREVTENWKDIMAKIKFGANQIFNTDLAYALTARILGEENLIVPGDVPGLIHMKSAIIDSPTEDWTQSMVWEFGKNSFRINTIEQLWPVHYHVKDFYRYVEEYHG